MDTNEINRVLNSSKKKTLVKAYVRSLRTLQFEKCVAYGDKNGYIIFCEISYLDALLKRYKSDIVNITIEGNSCNSSIPLKDVTHLNARIEPGAIIREYVDLKDNCVILMGAIINIGASIGEKTMIDMGAIIGSGAIIKSNCHIGAGAVIAGVVEPNSLKPVIIEENVLVGANAVILEGCHIGRNSIIGAGSIVTRDVPDNVVVYGNPAKIIKKIDERTIEKTKIIESLRQL